MILTQEIKKSIQKSVLCWLASVSDEGLPNVSPKEVFTNFRETHLIVANIASPQSVRNIKENPQVCVSFIDIFVQKGFQLKGKANILKKSDEDYSKMEAELLKITEGKFPFSSIISIEVESVKPIIAPKYILYPDTMEAQQIESAIETYQIKEKI